jgi:hypothetical protein
MPVIWPMIDVLFLECGFCPVRTIILSTHLIGVHRLPNNDLAFTT